MSKVLTDQIEKRTGGTAMDVPSTGKWPTANIADDAVTATQIAADAVGSSEIAANAVTASEIAATTITPAQMANSAFLANRNMIINGAMQISQRATSAAAVGAGLHTVDRWYTTKVNSGTWTQTQDAAVVGTAGFGYSLKNDCTTALGSLAAGDRLMMSYRFEGQNCQSLKKGTASAESVTISFWVKATKTGTYVLEMWDHPNARHICSLYTVSASDTWEYKTVTFAGDTTGALTNDNSKILELHWYLAAGSNYTSGTLATTWAVASSANRAVGQVNAADSTSNNFSLAGVQMEVGITATPFEHQSVGQQLAACLRYFEKESLAQTYMVSNGDNAGFMAYDLNWGVKKRATPTVTFSTWAVYNYVTSLGNETTANGWSVAGTFNADSANIGASKASHGLGNLFTMRLINVTLSADAEL